MKQSVIYLAIAGFFCFTSINASAQIKMNSKGLGALGKGLKAVTFSDSDAAKLASEAVAYMDTHNTTASETDPYTIRLKKLFAKHQNEGGLKLNFKVYKVSDINAFACADGSVRVFSSLMDLMTDDELLGIIGHEIGHVANKDTRDAVRSAYKREALTDAASSQSGVVNTLSETQVGAFASALLENKYSRKQESEADDFAYNFMKTYNYKVASLASAFNKFAEMENSSNTKRSKSEKMLSSHPESADRAAKVLEKAKKDGLVK